MSKKSVVVFVLIGIMVGVTLGYAWRMVQIEPVRDREVYLLSQRHEALVEKYWEVLGKYEACMVMKKRLGVSY